MHPYINVTRDCRKYIRDTCIYIAVAANAMVKVQVIQMNRASGHLASIRSSANLPTVKRRRNALVAR